MDPQEALVAALRREVRLLRMENAFLRQQGVHGAPRDTALGLALPGFLGAPPQLPSRARSSASGAAEAEAQLAPRQLSASLDEPLGSRCGGVPHGHGLLCLACALTARARLQRICSCARARG